jgi:hypothetical protein
MNTNTRVLVKAGWAINTLIGVVPTDVVKVGDDGGFALVDLSAKLKTVTFQMTNGAAAGKVLQSDAAGNATWESVSGSGTVTTVSVVGANGLTGTVANPTTAPAITLSTSITGVLKGNGTAISAASDGTDYLSSTTGVLKSLFDAHTVLYATADNTPLALTIGEQTVLGRVTGGNISALAIDSDLTTISAGNDTLPSALAAKTYADTKQYNHGIEANGALSFVNATHILTVAAGANTYWYKGIRYTTASAITCDIDSFATLTANTLYYFWFDDATGTLKCNTSFWDLNEKVPVATVFWNGSAGAIINECHSYKRASIPWHIWAHKTIGARYVNDGGLGQTAPTTAADATLTIESGSLQDEDIVITVGQQTTMRAWYQASAGVYTFADYAIPFIGSVGTAQFLRTTDYTLQNVGATNFACYWVYGCADTTRNLYVIPTQAAASYNTIALARAELQPTLVGLNISQEMKLLYRWIYRGDGQYQEGTDFRNTSSLPGGGAITVSAVSVTFAPSGSIAATNVQSALEELDTEKAPLASPTFTGTVTGTFSGNVTGNLTGTASDATNFTVANEATDTTCFPVFVTAATGSLPPKSNAGLTFNSATGVLASTFSGNLTGNVTGNASTVTGLSVTAAKTLTVTNSLTLSGTDGTTMTFPATSSTVMTLASTDTISGVKSFNDATLKLSGSTSGATTLKASAIASTYVVTLPAATDTLVGKATTDTLTNKRITMRVTNETSSATPTINTDNSDVHEVTALTTAITNMNANFSGTPTNNQMLLIRITGTAARAITWNGTGTTFEDWTYALPTTTVTTKTLEVLLQYHTSSSKWGCVYTASQL